MLDNKQLEEILLQLIAEVKELKAEIKKQEPMPDFRLMPQQSPDKQLLPGRDFKKHLFHRDDFIMIEGKSECVDMYVLEGSSVAKKTVSYGMKTWKPRFEHFGFLKVTRNRMANPRQIIDYDPESHFIMLTGNLNFEVQHPYCKMLDFYYHRVKVEKTKSGKKRSK